MDWLYDLDIRTERFHFTRAELKKMHKVSSSNENISWISAFCSHLWRVIFEATCLDIVPTKNPKLFTLIRDFRGYNDLQISGLSKHDLAYFIGNTTTIIPIESSGYEISGTDITMFTE